MAEESGCRPIGSLVQRTLTSLSVVDSTPEPSPTSLPITGTRFPEAGAASLIGPPRSGTGVVAKPDFRHQDPAQNDEAIVALLPPSVRSALRATESIREFIDPVYGFDIERKDTGYMLAAAVMPHDRQAAIGIVAAYMAPCGGRLVREELARLRASTKSRQQSDDDLAMTFQVLAEECQEYPPDVVRWALRSWARRETFFPSLAEIRDELQRHSRRRRLLLECLNPECR